MLAKIILVSTYIQSFSPLTASVAMSYFMALMRMVRKTVNFTSNQITSMMLLLCTMMSLRPLLSLSYL